MTQLLTLKPAAPEELEAKAKNLRARLKAAGRAIVAYSGGVDSAFLAWAAREALGEDAVAVTAVSPSLAEDERADARRVAEQIGIAYREVETFEMENPSYLANNPDRCFHCKTELFSTLSRVAEEEGYTAIMAGYIADDAGDYRPGMQAARQWNVQAPLLEAGLGKAEVRTRSERVGLPTWDKPALACLASRFPYGSPIQLGGLRQVDHSERFLREQGFRQVRVRHHGDTARIEVPAEEIGRFADPELREAVVKRLKGLGYSYVAVDLQGFRSGSMNEVLETQNAE